MLSSFAVFVVLVHGVHSARILGVFATPSISHQVVFQPVWRELSLRGHQITVITPDPLKNPQLTNLTEIDLHDLSYDIWNKHKVAEIGSKVQSDGLKSFIDVYTAVTSAQLESPQVQAIINDNTAKYDLVIVEFLWPTMFAFKEKFMCPMVGISSMPLTLTFHDIMHNPSHPITHPDHMLPFSRNLSFKERLISVVYSVLSRLFSLKIQNVFNEQINKYFTNITKTARQLAEEVSLTLINSNPMISLPRPNLPNVIEISGVHIKSPEPLPKDLKTFLDNSKNGVVYFSLGSNVKSSHLSKEKIEMITDAFRELPYDIIWKFEKDFVLKNKTKNLHTWNWLPQQDLLRHPNVKLFVMQGGIQSIEEALIMKTPLIVIPFFADQFGNARTVEDIRVGRMLDFHSLTKEKLRDTILEVMTNKSYSDEVTKLSEILADQQIGSLEKMIWWIEYVIRHKGAPHLKGPVVPLYQYFMLDVVSFALIVLLIVSYIFVKLTKLLLKTTYIL